VTPVFWRRLAPVFLVAASCTALFLARSEPLGFSEPSASLPIDFHKYAHMVGAPFGSFHIAPFCWRIGAPLLAKLLPFSPLESLLIVALASVLATGMLVYATAYRLGFSQATSMLGMLLYFSMGHAAKGAIHAAAGPDALLCLFTVGALYLGVTGHIISLAVVLAAGVTVKESALLVAPLIYAIEARSMVDVAAIKKYALVCLPAVAILALIRIAIPAYNDDATYLATLPGTLTQVQQGSAHYDYLELLRTVGSERLRDLSLAALRSYTVETFDLLPLALLAVRIDRSARWLPRLAPYAVAIVAPIFVATDESRLLVLAFPAIILLALRSVDAIVEQTKLRAWDFAPLAIAMIGLHAWTRGRMYISLLDQLALVATGTVYLIGVHAWRARRRRAEAVVG
jgi:hypothetical protein